MHTLEKPIWREETRDAFHSTKTFENLEKAANGTKISHKSFQKLRKLLIFRMQTIQPKILEIPGAKLNVKKTSGRKFDIPREVVLFFGNFRQCCSIR